MSCQKTKTPEYPEWQQLKNVKREGRRVSEVECQNYPNKPQIHRRKRTEVSISKGGVKINRKLPLEATPSVNSAMWDFNKTLSFKSNVYKKNTGVMFIF